MSNSAVSATVSRRSDLEGEAQGIQFDIRQRADFQPHPPHPAIPLPVRLGGDGFDDAFAQRKLVHGAWLA
jgi:hypothetical protein